MKVACKGIVRVIGIGGLTTCGEQPESKVIEHPLTPLALSTSIVLAATCCDYATTLLEGEGTCRTLKMSLHSRAQRVEGRAVRL